MKLIQKFELRAKEKSINIGIGLGDSEHQNLNILKASLNFLKEYDSNISILGKKNSLNSFLKQDKYKKKYPNITYVECENPEKEIFKLLSLNSIQAIVRGSLSSNEFLKTLKMNLNVKDINRLALLETFNGHQFFFGPVGIDECNNIEKKISFLESAIKELKKIGIIPKISILSGGRKSDIGRDDKVDKTIEEADKIVELMENKIRNLIISHNEILIEEAILNEFNIIIAPDGISGNLIYRTLVHLGGGKAYGAIYMDLDRSIIDTSRVGKLSEIYGALLLAQALSK
ncbi:MAG: methanogenesis marker protein Mmp4/MtxX [Candidatus Hodarchaeota archaeon]